MSTVLLTGANGFLGLHVLNTLLSQGYEVVATVRSSAKEKDVLSVAKSYPERIVSVEYVPDIAANGAYDAVFKAHQEITAVVHTATPVTFMVEDPIKELVEPAVNGTLNIARAAKAYGPLVEKVVVTSSYSALDDLLDPSPKDAILNENSWNKNATYENAKINGMVGYLASKPLAEKALWEFAETEKPHFTVTTIVPPFIFGPYLSDAKTVEALNGSCGVFYQMLTGAGQVYTQQFACDYVDVRDCAKAHVIALEKPQAAGRRFLVSAGGKVGRQFIDVVDNAGVMGYISPDQSVDSEQILADRRKVDNSISNRILGLEYLPVEKTAVDAAQQFIDNGLIKVET
jgi:NADPH-dependent methylglyoxal reductase